MTMTVPAATLLTRVRDHAARRPSAQACVFAADGTDHRELTYAQLDATTLAIAAGLRSRLSPGDRALLLVPEGQDFVPAFLGCLRAGVVAVPAYPPLSAQSRQRLDTLAAIAADCRPAAVLTSAPAEQIDRLRAAVPGLAGVWWAQVRDLAAGLADPAADHPADPAHPAFLQYTSGSTALPKGVVVTHGALAHNLELMRVALRHDERLRMVSWLPMFHDMGLIGNVLAPLWVGGTMILMEPLAFVKRPARWLRLIDRERATVSGGPNFAYDLCVRRVRDEEIEGLDLSGWRSAFNGAEPIRPATLRAFAERFAPYGFRPNAWWPCYGLAEATLFVTGNTVGAEPTTLDVDPDALQLGDVVPADGGRTLVSSGRTWLDRTVLIVDPDTRRPVLPGRVGEIWIGGPGLPAGYWENPEATEETFGARTVGGDPDDGPYLRSGDLGFVHEGELYVTGRLKDVLIVAGRNHYPQDIEATAEDAHPAIRKGCVAAFSVDDGDGERVVVVAGAGQGAVKPGEQGAALRAEIARAVRARVTAEHGIEVHDVAVVGPNTVPKTSSGKLQRRACRAAYLAGRYALDADPAGGPAGERTEQTERHESERRTVR